MLLLAVNSATTSTGIALLENGKIIAEKNWLSNKDEMEKLLPAIQQILKQAKAGFDDLDGLFVVAGPGSFSGLRIGVTIVNALAFTHKLPVFSANTFQLLLAKVPEPKRPKTAIIISAGGKNIAVFWKGKIKQMEIEKFAAWQQKNKILTVGSDLKAEQKKQLQKQSRTLKFEKLKSFGEAVLSLLQQKLPGQKMVKPIYLQKPNITKSKKKEFV